MTRTDSSISWPPSAAVTRSATANQPFTRTFQLVLSGEVISASIESGLASGALLCRYLFVYGPDWSIISGEDQAISQSAYAARGSSRALSFFSYPLHAGGEQVVWNLPFSLIFKSTNPYGWPRLVLCVYGTDWLNRRVILGYTSAHVPTQPGRHVRTLNLYSITSSSWMRRFVAWMTGCRPEFVDPQTAARSEGREVVRTENAGRIKVCFNVLSRDLQQLQYSL
ncbi:B9-C2 domain-containing protein [Besnoitia besnoiti]|uniref:B9 domain-containing protein 1 n=1 Tax=Besnoitia besnoiti TaxID=94643 RepID=A0A2A9M676_BESBE|nr:B9-C2 domain-containing protein [Besnoitia besnoiti]PFH33459.1 B9-C2 domain-containing protein [Besnoitia besnoiti]